MHRLSTQPLFYFIFYLCILSTSFNSRHDNCFAVHQCRKNSLQFLCNGSNLLNTVLVSSKVTLKCFMLLLHSLNRNHKIRNAKWAEHLQPLEHPSLFLHHSLFYRKIKVVHSTKANSRLYYLTFNSLRRQRLKSPDWSISSFPVDHSSCISHLCRNFCAKWSSLSSLTGEKKF